MTVSIAADEVQAIAEEAYIYAFPMLMGYRFAYATFLEPASPAYLGPANHGPYGEAVTLDYTFKDVITPNADTPYSFGLLDLRAGPVVLTVPEISDRYYVMQFEDLLGYNELFVGSRATGTAAGSYLLVGPRWQGDLPDGFASTHRFETDLVILIGRSQLLDPDDQPALAEIMAQYRLEPLAVFEGGDDPELDPFPWPVWDDEASRDERFIGDVNTLLRLCEPPHPDETEMFGRFARAGIGHGLPFDLDALDPEIRRAIGDGVSTARDKIAEAATKGDDIVNGWASADPFGNRDFYGDNYLKRAAMAMGGWGGNDKIEAHYLAGRVDQNGDPLNGTRKYQMTLETLPPVRAFWSLTMTDTSYDGTAGYLVKNPIDRYLVNSLTQGLVRNADGGLTITMQHDEPTDPTERANWLPAPEGDFYLTFRMYWPETAVLDGTWEAPPVVRVS